MEPERTIEDELRAILESLQREIANARQREVDPREIDQRCDTLDMDWQDRLNDFEIGELRGCKRALDTAAQELHLQSRMDVYLRDAAALPTLTPEQQLAFWDGNRRSYDFELLAEERNKMTTGLYDTSRQQIQDRYADLREGLSRAVDEIREGKEPSLSFLVESQVEKEAERASRAEAFVKQYNERDNERER